jgi:hypothetical protein
MQFLDIMKGVSARLDENAGVRPRKDLGAASSSSSRTKKRTRGLSFGGTSELQSGKSSCGTLKKGRVDELCTSTRDEGKGKGRAASEDEALDSEMRGRGLQAHSSLPEMHSRSDLKRSLSSNDVNFMDVDNKDDDIDGPHVSQSAVSPSYDHGHPRTISQTEMPPPPLPFTHKQRHPAAADPPSTLTPLAVSRHSNSVNKPQTSYPPPQQPPTNYSIKQRKPDAVPKMHPLLYQKPVSTKVSSSSKATYTPQAQPQPQLQPQHLSTPIPVSEGVNLKPTSSPLMPLISSTPSSRPPPLGMRRNHTYPSRTPSSSSVRQDSSSLTGSRGQLPQRPKGFKPPLMSLSQPQAGTQSQKRDPPRAKANTNSVEVIEPGSSTIATSKKASSQNSPASFSPTNTSMALQSSTASSSDSSASFHSATSSVPLHSQSHSQDDASDCSRSNNKCNQGMTEQVAPGPPDGDTDSSFGDMSFDMDALEETMKMYD